MDSKEPSRIVHLRLKNSTILGCHKLTELQKGDMDVPMSSMLTTVLDNIIDKLVESGKLPKLDDIAAGMILGKVYVKVEANEDGIITMDIVEPDLLEDFLSDVEVDSEEIKGNLAVHELPLDKEFQKRSPDEQQVDIEEIIYPELAPWESDTGLFSFSTLYSKSPKDILIENASDNSNEHLKRALELVYSSIPIDMWGGEKAQKLIAEVMPMVIHYLGPMPVPTQSIEDEKPKN